MSNKYSDLLMQALDIAIDEKISTLQFDKTILATILSVVDLDTGEYRVKYKDGIISAFAADPKETFKQGDAVYVTVPESDFSNKKFISHRITNNSLSTSQYTELANTIFEVSPNFSDLGYKYIPYEEGQDCYGLIVGNNSSINILDSILDSENIRFRAYAELYEYIQISASFYNEFTIDHKVGDYGIELVLTNLDDKLVSYFLNLNDFNGDPYHLVTWSPQSAIIKIPKGLIKSVSAIKFYENEFVNEGNVANLFMSNFSLNFVDKVDLTEIPYYLNVLPLDGIAFTTNLTSLRLEGYIFHNGEELPESSCLFQWFERDLSVAPGDEAYDKRAGWGWRSINEATNKLLTVRDFQVPWLKSYKLVVVYNSTTLMTKEITLINGFLDIEIEQVTSGNAIYLKLTKDNYTGDWYYLASDGNLVAIQQSPRSGTSPDIVPYLLYSPMTFYCLVYLGSVYQGELNYVMQNIESKDDVSVVFSGESLFSYDANGDINIYDAELERSLQAEIVWKKGIISSSPTIRWLDFENNVIGSSWIDYSNKDSMLKKVRVDTTENILYYTVKHKFKQTPSKNNSFRVEISTTDGLVYSFDKEIVFTKTGDPGTNGTRYLSLITVTLDDIHKNKFVGINNSNTSITLNCKVYKDLAEFTGASVSWLLYNLAIISQSGMSISVRANNDVLKRYVKATITIVDEGKTTTLYDFYPVNSCASQPSIDLSELPKYILYASNGRNPLFRKLVPIIKYNGATATIASGDIAVIKIANNQFKPIDEFNPDNPIGLLIVTVSGITIYHPVPTYINTFGNEAINGWDGVSVDVDTAGGKILAPLVGAGTKNSANKFTGVVMGKDSALLKVGLYGYLAGVNSFGLTEEGKAYFGVAGKGRITIDGTSATISGGGGGTSTSGMTITLSAAASSADAIRVGNGNFIVNYGGKVTANGAAIRGVLSAGSGSRIGCTFNDSGTPKNDGWSVTENLISSGNVYLYSGSDKFTRGYAWQLRKDSVYYKINSEHTAIVGAALIITANTPVSLTVFEVVKLDVGGSEGDYVVFKFTNDNNEYCSLTANVPATSYYRIWSGNSTPSSANFVVTSAGYLVAKNATVVGSITATSGYIGGASGWTIDSNKIYGAKSNKYVALSTQGSYALFAGSSSSDDTGAASAPFWVKFDGSLLATDAVIQGKITATEGAIGNWKVNSLNDGALRSTLSDTGASTRIYLNGKPASGGNVIEIKTSASSVDDNLTVATNGRFYVTDQGKMVATNAEIHGTIKSKAGELGGWTINKDGLKKADDIYIYSNGSMKLKKNFAIDTSGNVTVKGDITATAGYIGWSDDSNKGWAITANKIYSNAGTAEAEDTTARYVALGSNGTYAIWAGDETPSKAPFSVTHQGKVTATSATISGAITATSGKIGNWLINSSSDGALRSTGTGLGTRIYLDGSATGDNRALFISYNATPSADDSLYTNTANGYFYVTANGKMYALAAEIRGTIKSKSGEIGAWNITSKMLSNIASETTETTSTTGMARGNVSGFIGNTPTSTNTIGNIAFWAGMGYKKVADGDYRLLGSDSGTFFAVTHGGKLYCRSADIRGSITATTGTIGGWKITSSRLENEDGTVWLSSSGGLHLGNSFSVSSSGYLQASGASVSGSLNVQNGGRIGNWYITDNKLTSANGEVYLGTTGFKLTDNFKVDARGNVTLNGTITWGSSSTPWEDDIPDVSLFITSSEATTLITDELVASPTLIGANVYGGAYHCPLDSDRDYNISFTKLNTLDIRYAGFSFRLADSIIFSIYDGDFGYVSLTAKNYNFLTLEDIGSGSAGIATPRGTWNFSNATVTGLSTTATFG